ncbi:MFS transporter, partial [Crossiella equi]
AEHFAPSDKEGLFGLTAGIGGLVGMIATILVGFASDRTTSKFGRRRPWIVAGAVLGSVSLVALGNAGSVAVMIIAWCGVQTAFGAMLAGLLASIPDRVPVLQRGLVGGWIGFAQTIGGLVGIIIATSIKPAMTSYVVLAVLLVLLALPFVLRSAEAVLRREQRPPGGVGALLSGFYVSPSKHPDFAWALLNRLLMNLGFVMGTLYTLYILQDVIRSEHPQEDLLLVTLLNAVVMVPAAIFIGGRSDKARKRKKFIFVSGLVVTLSSVMLVPTITWPLLLASTVVLAVSFGAFVAVDTALLTEVLPAAEHRAKDLGVINISHGIPQVVGPLVATAVLGNLGGYAGLFAVSGVLTLIGSFLIFRIRSVA